MKEEKVVIFSAPSGSGKTTLVKYALEQYPDLAFSISCTTRPPRGEEKDAVDYYFLSVDDFKQRIENGDFVEFEEVYKDKFYGTLKSEVERIWANGKIVIFDVDVMGGINLKNYYKDKALSIFVMPPSVEELRTRLHHRGTDDHKTIEERVAKAEIELKVKDKFDTVLINHDLLEAKSDLASILNAFIKEEK